MAGRLRGPGAGRGGRYPLSKLAEVVRASDVHIGGASRLMFRSTVAPFTAEDDKGLVGAMRAGASLAHKDLGPPWSWPRRSTSTCPWRRWPRTDATTCSGSGSIRRDRGRRGPDRGLGEERMLIGGTSVALDPVGRSRTVNPATEEVSGWWPTAAPRTSTPPSRAARTAFDESDVVDRCGLRVRGLRQLQAALRPTPTKSGR